MTGANKAPNRLRNIGDKKVEDRLNLRLTPEAKETLEWIAAERGGVSFAEVIRRALGTERFLVEAIKNGGKIIVEPSRGRSKELRLI